MASSSARPDELRRLVAVVDDHDRALGRLAADLDDAVEAWARTQPATDAGIAAGLGAQVRALAIRSQHLLAWVARIAAAFERADAGSLSTVSDTALLNRTIGHAETAEARADGRRDAGGLRRILNAHDVSEPGAWPADWESLATSYPRIATFVRRVGAGRTDPVYAAAVLDGLGEDGVRRFLVLVEQLGAVQTRAHWDRPDLDIVAADLADDVLRPFATLFAAGHRSAVSRSLLSVDDLDQRRHLALLASFGDHDASWAAAAAHALLTATREEGRFAVAPSANGLFLARPELRSIELAAVRLLQRDPEAAFRFVTDEHHGKANTAALLHSESPEPSSGLEAASAEVLQTGFGAYPLGGHGAARAVRSRRADLAFQHVVAATADAPLSGRMRRAVGGLVGTGRKLHLLAAEAADAHGADARWTTVTMAQAERFVTEIVRDGAARRMLIGQATAYADEQARAALVELRRHGDAGGAATVFVAEGDRVGSLYGLVGLGLAQIGEVAEHRYGVLRGSLKAVTKEALDGLVTAGRFSGPWGVAGGIGVEAAVALGGAALDGARSPTTPAADLLSAAEQDLTDTVRAIVRADPALGQLLASGRIDVDDVANAFGRAATGAPHLVRALTRS